MIRRPSALLLVLALAGAALSARAAAPFKDFIIFGDSLSDVGNIASRVEDNFFVRYPGPEFGYTDGRFTDGKDTEPAVRQRKGVWHEQLAANYFGLPKTKASADGGSDYAFGGARTIAGSSKRSLFDDPNLDDDFSITIDDMGKQVVDYLADHAPDPASLFVLWGGANDILGKQDAATVTAAANNVHGYLVQLANAGARNFLVINVPPIGMVPNYKDKSEANALNEACASYATQLSATVDAAQAELAGRGIAVKVYKLDVYNLFLRYLQKAAAYGFVNVTDFAQDQDVNPDKYLFWDGLHPTTRGHALIAAEAYTALTGTPVVSLNTIVSDVAETAPTTTFFLTRTGLDLTASLIVPITSSGSAIPGVDYVPKSAKAMKPGKAARPVNIGIINDPIKESDETITLTISENAGYIVGFPKTATTTIRSDDK